jgi:hypothetical protein
MCIQLLLMCELLEGKRTSDQNVFEKIEGTDLLESVLYSEGAKGRLDICLVSDCVRHGEVQVPSYM